MEFTTKVLVRGPMLTRTGYGEHARSVLRALRLIEGVEIFIMPTQWGQSAWIWEDNEERKWMDECITKTVAYNAQQNVAYDLSIQVGIPNEWQRFAPVNIGVTAGIETTKVAPIWLEKANMMDRIITISEHSKAGFTGTVYEGTHKETGQRIKLECTTPVDIVHYPVKHYEEVDLGFELDTEFNFLTVAQWGPRKNIEVTVQWFVEEFIDNPDVGLVVKTFAKGGSIIDRVRAENTLTQLLNKYPKRQCKVYLLHGDMSEEEMHSLYKHPQIKSFVSLTHGEGFGLPHFEAAYSGLPVIAPEWSGYLDFLCMPKTNKKGKTKVKPYFATVEYEISPIQQQAVWEGVLQADSMWAYADQGSYKMRLREMHKDYGRFKKDATELQSWIHENFSLEQQSEKMVNIFKDHITWHGTGANEELDLDEWVAELESTAVSYE